MVSTRIRQNLAFPGRYNSDPPFTFMGSDIKKTKNRKDILIAPPKELNHHKLNILLADDDDDDRELFKEALEEVILTVNLDFAEDGSRLLEQLNHSKNLPDLIFLDLNMPHKTGMECLETIRNDERLKNIPIIIYSTSSSTQDINNTFEKGANLYVKKPSSFNELLNILRNLIFLDWNHYKPYAAKNQYLFNPKKK